MMKRTKGLLKLTKSGVATLMFGDIRPPTISREATETCPPVMHCLLANAYVFLVIIIIIINTSKASIITGLPTLDKPNK